MRFLELNLIAYGPFTEHRLDLSAGNQGLHLVYGSNEAGKSSSLRAITDFLYGIPQRTEDNFIHPYSQLRIGATVRHSDGTELRLIRRKAQQKTLRYDDDETPVEPMEFARFLGDVDRDFFGMMFGINHDRLRRGGQEIASGKGKLGEMLFAAGAGLSGLQLVQQGLQSDIDGLMKSSGRSGAIHDGILELTELKKDVALAQISVETWKQRLEQFENADQRRIELEEQLSRLRAELDRLSRIEKSLTAIGLWRTHQRSSLSLAKAPKLDADFSRRASQLISEWKQSQTQQQDAQNALAQIERELAAITDNGDLLELADEMDSLRDRFGHYRRSLQDRPSVLAKGDLLDQESLQILGDLDFSRELTELEALRIPADRKTRIHQLGLQWERLQERTLSEQKAIERTRLQLEQARRELAESPEPSGSGPAKSILQTVMQQGDLDQLLMDQQQATEILASRLERELKRLSGWQGELSRLESLSVPTLSTIERFEKEWSSAQSDLRQVEHSLSQERDVLREVGLELNALEKEQPVATLEDLDRWRRRRSQLWKWLQSKWRGENPDGLDADSHPAEPGHSLEDEFANSVEQADLVSDRLRTDAQRVAMKAKLLMEQERSAAKAHQFEKSVAMVLERIAGVQQEWLTVWRSLGIEPLAPSEMKDWYRQYQAILEMANELRESQSRCQQWVNRLEQAKAALRGILPNAERRSDFDQTELKELTRLVADHCEQLQSASHRRQEAQKRLAEVHQELATAELDLSRSEQELKRLSEQWCAEMRFLRLPPNALPSQADTRLSMIAELLAKRKEAERYRQRVEHIDRDAQKFADDVASLFQRFCPEQGSPSTEDQFQTLLRRFEIQHDAARQRQLLLERRRELQEKHSAAEQSNRLAMSTLNQMMTQANVMAVEHLLDAAQSSYERTVAEEKLAEAERQIASFANGTAITEFVAEVDAELARNESLSYRIEQLKEGIQFVSAERDEVLGEIKAAEIELQKFDGNNDAAEKNSLVESVVARIEEQVHSLAVLKMSAAVLTTGIERYREKHQGPILQGASRIFQEITLGQYTGLRTDFNEKGEPVVLGLRSGTVDRAAGSVGVEAMSDGTCDQLYLALRLASLESWLKHHEPIPLIVDDILLNFDDDRSLATLKVLARLSQYTQVIFFTHHQHLCDLAEKNLPSGQLFVTRLEQRHGADKLQDWLF